MEHQNNGNEMEDEKCHLFFCWTPSWARVLATRRVFIACYTLVSIVQGMSFIFIVSSLTTIESHFQLPSETFGLIISLGEICCIIAGIVTGLLVGVKTHRPICLGVSLLLLGIGNNLFAMPYYIYGDPMTLDNDINGTTSFSLCVDNSTNFVDEKCVALLLAPNGSTRWSVGLIFLLAYSISNVGATAVYIIGTPYIDDNVQNKNSPMYLAFMCSVRTIGPVFGTILSTYILAINIDPMITPLYDKHDPRWVGAWWLGYVIIGTLSALSGFLVAQFPRRLQSKNLTPAMQMDLELKQPINSPEGRAEETLTVVPSLKEIISSIRRIMFNGLLLVRILSEMFTWFALEGFLLYMPKYLEHQFHISSSEASTWTGTAFLFPSVVGDLLVGFLVQKLQPTTKQLAGALTIAKTVQAIIMAILPALQCEKTEILGSGKSFSVCKESCDCSDAVFSPICGSDKQSYFSACHAGCSNFTSLGEEMYNLTNCACILNGGFATQSICQLECPQKIGYLILVAISKLCLSVDIVAGTLFVLRCVEPHDKTIATGYVCAFLGIFTFIPCPIIFSAAVDNTCKVWSEQCGNRRGACNVYDMQALRLALHFAPAGLLAASAIFDGVFWWLAKTRLKLFQDEMTKT